MLPEHGIEDVIGGGEKNHGADEQPDGQKDAADIGPVSVDGDADKRQKRDGEQRGVERNGAGSDEVGGPEKEQTAERERRQIDHARLPLAAHHGLGEGADDNQRHQQDGGREEKRRNEQPGDQQNGNAKPLVEPLAVEDEEKRTEDDTGPGVVLQDDDEKRRADDRRDLEQIAGPRNGERIGTHDAGERQGGGYLDEFGGLDTERPELKPRLGTVDFLTEQKRSEEEGQPGEISRIGEHVDEPLVQEQDDQRGDPRDADPDELLHVEMREGERSERILLVSGRENRQGPGGDDGQVEEDRPDVDPPEDVAKTLTDHNKDNKYSCS